MELETIIAIAGAVVMASRIVLKVIAPLTKTKVDDSVLNFLTKVLEHVSLKL